MNENRLAFVVMCWNVRGLGSFDKCDLVRASIDSVHPHIVCLQETKLDSLPAYHPSFLPSVLDSYHDLPATHTCGGICTAWNSRFFNKTSFISRRFSLTVCLVSTITDHTFFLTNVYAPSDHRDSDIFFHELLELATHITGAWLLAGDFNLLRAPSDKNSTNFNTSLAASFNTTLNDLALLELPLLDRLYTWSNKRAVPTLARLDRVLINSSFSSLLPDTTLTSRPHATSDHVPLVVTIHTTTPRPLLFRFENS
ncbi:unnamed protein product [Urochloa humidicola]